MKLPDLLLKIDENKRSIGSYGKFDEKILKKINYKFRLDWNYYSNVMEGNSLTKEETRSVMMDVMDINGKSFKDVREMRGHDNVVLDVLKIGKGDLRLSEARIKNIHKAIVYEEDPEKAKQVGQWKTANNHLINYRGEKFDFSSPDRVPGEMHNLLNWLNSELNIIFSGVWLRHPVVIAAEFHVRYLTIHPFFDGNGRTARILSNLILIACGYPPIIIKKEEKENIYYKSLADIQAYGGDPDIFINFFAEKVIESQQKVLDAIAGKDIDDDDDLDKRLKMFERELQVIGENHELKKTLSFEVVKEIFNSWIKELLLELIPTVQKFNKYYTNPHHHIGFNQFGTFKNFSNEPATDIINSINKILDSEYAKTNFQPNDLQFSVFLNYGSFRMGGVNTFGCKYNIIIGFDYIKYSYQQSVFTEDGNSRHEKKYEKLLHQSITHKEIKELVKEMGDTLLKHMQFHAERIKKENN
jgi:Fic family protein